MTEAANKAMAGASKEYLQQQKIGALFEEALTFLRSTARTNDYFSGYSIGEVIDERLKLIGEAGSDDQVSYVNKTKGRYTLIGKLNHLKNNLVGEDGKSGLIGEAMGVKDFHELEYTEDGS